MARCTLRAGDDLATVGRNIDACDSLIVTSQLILERVLVSGALVQIDYVLAGYGEGLTVGGEGMVRNRVVEEMVDFWRSHGGRMGVIGDSLLLLSAGQ